MGARWASGSRMDRFVLIERGDVEIIDNGDFLAAIRLVGFFLRPRG